MGLVDRLQAPTPAFFKKLRTIGLVLAAVSGSLVASPIAVPLVVVKIAGYLAVAGGVLTAVSQTAVSEATTTAYQEEYYE
jgi:ABC-type xylose transport system permease subunit